MFRVRILAQLDSGGCGILQLKVIVLPWRIARLVSGHFNLDRDLGTSRPVVGRIGFGLKYRAEAEQHWSKYLQDGGGDQGSRHNYILKVMNLQSFAHIDFKALARSVAQIKTGVNRRGTIAELYVGPRATTLYARGIGRCIAPSHSSTSNRMGGLLDLGTL